MNLFHFNVVCSDFDASYDFYTKVVGMRPLTSSRAGTAGDTAPRAGYRPGEGRPRPEDAAQVAELLGFEGSGDYRGAFLYFGDHRGGAYVDLLQWADGLPAVPRSPRNVGLSRVCIHVDDLDIQVARLAEHNVALVTSPKEFVLGVTRVRVVCFRDPDGVLLEYLQFVDDKPWGS